VAEICLKKKRKKSDTKKFNIFEGSRRLLKLIQITSIIVILCIFRNKLEIIEYIGWWYFGTLLFGLIIGWIVRGFLNIPNWQDSRNIKE
jgi:hypothetical protein